LVGFPQGEMKLPDSFYKLCRIRATGATLMGKLASCLATENLTRRRKATCSLSLFGATTFPLVCLSHKKFKTAEEEEDLDIKKDGVSDTIER